MNELVKKFYEKAEELRIVNAEVHRKKNELDILNEQLSGRVSEVDEQVAKARAKADEAEKEKTLSIGVRDEAKNERDEIKQEVTRLEKQQADLLEEVDTLTKIIAEAKQEAELLADNHIKVMASMESEQVTLEGQLTTMKEFKLRLERELKELQMEIIAEAEELARMKEQHKAMEIYEARVRKLYKAIGKPIK